MLLLDEPLGALDLKLREQMQIELKEIQRDVGITFMIVTHDQDEALTLCDRLAVFNDGRIEQVGTARGVYEQPANRFVADFVGTSNVIDGSARAADRRHAGHVRDPAGIRIAVFAPPPRPEAGRRCRALVRGTVARSSTSGPTTRLARRPRRVQLSTATVLTASTCVHPAGRRPDRPRLSRCAWPPEE